MALPFTHGFSRLEVPECGIPLGLGMVVKINLLNVHVCVHMNDQMYRSHTAGKVFMK